MIRLSDRAVMLAIGGLDLVCGAYWAYLAATAQTGLLVALSVVIAVAWLVMGAYWLRRSRTGGFRSRTVRRLLLAALSGAVLAACGVMWARDARADVLPPGCVQQPWWYGSAARMTTRTICDGVLREDGSWTRQREFTAPPSYVPASCSWSRYGGGCSGGYWLPLIDTGVETYPVTPDTVLADEPQHIGADA